ncbi:MAG: hypothetical protein R3A10_23570 [Caldilineaceae bacterium]
MGLSILLTACVAGTVPGDGAAADTSGAAAAVTPAQTDGTPTTSLGNMSTVSTMVIDRRLDEIERASTVTRRSSRASSTARAGTAT